MICEIKFIWKTCYKPLPILGDSYFNDTDFLSCSMTIFLFDAEVYLRNDCTNICVNNVSEMVMICGRYCYQIVTGN